MTGAREEFARYLELSGRHTDPALEPLRKRWSGRVVQVGVTRSTVEAELGPPDHATADTLGYRLSTRPGYTYVFRFGPDDCWRWSGFERDGPMPSMPPAMEWPAFVAALAAVGATESELMALLGPPLDVIGWWPIESWTYPAGVVDLRHGVVER